MIMKYDFINHSFIFFFLDKFGTIQHLIKTKKGDHGIRLKVSSLSEKKNYLLHWRQSSQKSTRVEPLNIHCIGLSLKHNYFQHCSMCRMLDLLLFERQNLACESFKDILNIKCKN